jgi:DHA1 family quinolone resistance protein-like MFS transporter
MMKTIKQIEWTYYTAMALFWFSVALPTSLLVLLLQARGMSLFQISIAMGLYSLTIVLLEVPTGGLADAVGRKRVALIAYTLMAFTMAALLVAFSFPLLLLGFVFYGAGRALSSGALDAWFVDALQTIEPEVELQPKLAKAGMFSLMALGTGALLGGALPRLFANLPADGTAVITPLAVPVLFSLVIKVVLVSFVALAVKEERPFTHQSGWRQGFQTVPVIVTDAFQLSRQNPTIILLLGASLASGLAMLGIETFWQPQFAVLQGGVENTLLFGLAMAGSFFAGVVGNVISTPLSRMLGKRYGLLAALARGLQGLFLILLALQTAVPLFILLFWLVYLNMGVLDSPHSTLINNEIPSERRSAMLSVQSLAGYVGGVIGSVALGLIAENASVSAAWIVAGSILMVSLFMYLRVDGRQRKQKRIHESEKAVFTTGEEANLS